MRNFQISVKFKTGTGKCSAQIRGKKRIHGGVRASMAGPLDVPAAGVVERGARREQPPGAGRKPGPSAPAHAHWSQLPCSPTRAYSTAATVIIAVPTEIKKNLSMKILLEMVAFFNNLRTDSSSYLPRLPHLMSGPRRSICASRFALPSPRDSQALDARREGSIRGST